MKGIVFTHLLEMVESTFGEDMVDDIIDASGVPSGGVYTAVGTYPHTEIVALVVALSEHTRTPVPDLLQAFGHHLFGQFVAGYPTFFEGVNDSFTLLSGIEDVIHAEVQKLYPEATLPKFDVEQHTDDRLVMVYTSPRHMEDLAEGLIRACTEHFGDDIDIAREQVGEGPTRRERFTLTQTAR